MVQVSDDVRVRDNATDFEIAVPDEKGKVVWCSVRKLIEGTMWIITKKSKDSLLILNPEQERLFFKICERLRDHKSCKFIILKARQLGFTTFISAFIFVMTFYRKNQNAVVIANTNDNTSMIFRKYQHYYTKLAEKHPILAPKLQNLSGNRMMTQDTEQGVRVAPATENAVVGTTIQLVHLSECGRMTNMRELMEAVLAAVPQMEDNPVTFVFLESTAKGFNDFKDYWDIAVEGRNSSYGFVPLFFPWFEEKSYRRPYDGFQLMPEEKAIMEKYHLDLEQMAFYRSKFIEYGKKWDSLRQEYPCCPSEAFVSTGSSVFDQEMINKRKDEVRRLPVTDGFFTYETKSINGAIDDFDVFNKVFSKSEGGTVRLFEYPIEGVPYVIGVDTAEGSGNDSTVAYVTRNDTKKQVAIFSSNALESDRCALQIYCLGIFYGGALIGVENNKSTSITRMLKNCNYPNLYIREVSDESAYDNVYMKYGVKTTSINKPQMKDLAVEICRDTEYKNVSDYGTLCEMESFIYEESEKSDAIKIKGAGSKHDDKVMALLINCYISKQQTSLTNVYEEAEKKVTCWALTSNEETNDSSEEEFSVW